MKFPSLFDTDHSSAGARQWFTIASGTVHQAKDHCLFGEVELVVAAKRLEKTEEGYKDAELQDPNDPAAAHARNFTQNLPKIKEFEPSVAELYEVAKAITLAKWMAHHREYKINAEKIQVGAPPRVQNQRGEDTGRQAGATTKRTSQWWRWLR